MLRFGVRFVAAVVILACAAAIGAPDKPGAPQEKKVFPLEKQDGVWWAGIADLCELAGAKCGGVGEFVKIGRASCRERVS